MTAINVLHGCCTVQLTQGKNTLVDAADWAELNQRKWSVSFDGYSYYAVRAQHISGSGKQRKQRKYKIHRVVSDAPTGMHVDHRDGDTLNNTRANLRIATPAENKRNRRRTHGASRFKGIWAMHDRWQAAIQVDGVRKYLGTFRTQEAAARAYDAAAAEYHGVFACTNADLVGSY